MARIFSRGFIKRPRWAANAGAAACTAFEVGAGQANGVNMGKDNDGTAMHGVAFQVPFAIAGTANRAEAPNGIDVKMIHGGGSPANGTPGKQIAKREGWRGYRRGGRAGGVTIHFNLLSLAAIFASKIAAAIAVSALLSTKLIR